VLCLGVYSVREQKLLIDGRRNLRQNEAWEYDIAAVSKYVRFISGGKHLPARIPAMGM